MQDRTLSPGKPIDNADYGDLFDPWIVSEVAGCKFGHCASGANFVVHKDQAARVVECVSISFNGAVDEMFWSVTMALIEDQRRRPFQMVPRCMNVDEISVGRLTMK